MGSPRTVFAATVVMLIATSTVFGRPGDADLARRLDVQKTVLHQLETDLMQAREEAARTRESEANAAQRYIEASNRVSLIEHSIDRLARSESLLVSDINEALQRRELITERIMERERMITQRARVLYMQGRQQPYQRALLASSLTHWMAARKYMVTLNQRDKIDIDRLLADRARVDSLTTIYREQRAALDTLLARRRRQYADLLGAKTEAHRLLERVRRDRQLIEQAAEELAKQREASHERISDYLVALKDAQTSVDRGHLVSGASVASPVDFTVEKGRLPWPVEGRVLSEFGRQYDAESRTWTRNRGIEIGVPRGTAVRAVASGTVVMVDWFRGYGTFVIVSHGNDYYTLYASMESISVRRDDRVRQGQIVGVSGGGDAFGQEKVHFEVLTGHEALNPLEWLAPMDHGS